MAWPPVGAASVWASVVRMACACRFHLVAVVRPRHRDSPLIDTLVLDSRKNVVVPNGGEGTSVKGIGCVAAVIVSIGTIAARAAFGAV
jgi:hypothetical protein